MDPIYHVSIYDHEEGERITPGRWGQSLNKRPLTAITSVQTITEIIYECVRKELEERDHVGRISRFECVFGCATLEFARFFRDAYVLGGSVYEVTTDEGTPITRADCCLITYDNATIPIAIERAKKYWSSTPVQIDSVTVHNRKYTMRFEEVLIGGPVTFVKKIC